MKTLNDEQSNFIALRLVRHKRELQLTKTAKLVPARIFETDEDYALWNNESGVEELIDELKFHEMLLERQLKKAPENKAIADYLRSIIKVLEFELRINKEILEFYLKEYKKQKLKIPKNKNG